MEVTEARATRFRDPYHAELPGNQWDTTAFQCQSPPALLTEVRVRTFKQFILLGAATLALAPAALAESNTGWYLGLEGGVNRTSDTDADFVTDSIVLTSHGTPI